MLTPDTVYVALKNAASSVNWLQIIIQTILFGIIIEFLRRMFQKELEFLKSEFAILQTTFSNNYSLVIDFFSAFTEHYRLCQEVVNSDVVQYSDGTSKRSDHIFLEKLDANVSEIKKFDPRIQLIFPQRVFQIYENSITAFNEFRDLVKSYTNLPDKPKKVLTEKFLQIDKLKSELEDELKKYLRTEKLYPN